jgi:D-alanyl-D-alanine carboxypeptidase/D-alanyl-D-alanine-endopeptidase (penicillin-binding protein 4)
LYHLKLLDHFKFIMANSTLFACLLLSFICLATTQPICTAQIGDYIRNVTSRAVFSQSTFAVSAAATFPRPYPQQPEYVELHNNAESTLVIPASNTKLFTTAAAFIQYGENYTFVTNVVGDLPNLNVSTPTESWTKLTNGPVAGRQYPKATYVPSSGKMYYWGGSDSAARRNDFAIYDTIANTWSTLTTAGAPVARLGHAQVLSQDGTKIYMYAGSGSAARLNDIWQYDIASNVWTAFAPTGAKPDIRSLPCGVATRFNTLIFFGGSQGFTKFFNDVWKFDLTTGQWSQVSPNGPIPAARSGSTCLLDGDNMLVYGGHVSSTSQLNELLKYDTTTDTWVTVPAPSSGDSPIARSIHAAVLTPDRTMVVFGGNNGADLASLQKYDVANNVWSTPATAVVPPARDSPVLVFNPEQSKVYLYGGTVTNPSITYVNDLWVMNYANTTELHPTLPSSSNTMCLVASGDPTLTTAKLQTFIAQLSIRGVKSVENFYLDTSVFAGYAESSLDWVLTDVVENYGAPAGALVVNKNAFTLTVLGGNNVNDIATISVAATEQGAIPITNNVITGTTTSISYYYIPGTNGLTVTGTIAVRGTYSTNLATSPSAPHFAKVLQNVANAANVELKNIQIAKCPLNVAASPVVYSFVSSPMSDILYDCLTNSDNLVGESLLRRLGADSGRTTGSATSNGISEVKRILGNAFPSLNLNSWFQIDGSGLSTTNRVNAKTIKALLQAINTLPNGETFKKYLPIAGETGTLNYNVYGRFGPTAPGRSVIRAKTGTVTGATALSGYVRSECSTPEIVFSLVGNTEPTLSTSVTKQALDDIANILARWENC